MYIDDIIQLCADEMSVTVDDMKGKKRFGRLVMARHLFSYFAYKKNRFSYFSLKDIAHTINRHHTTVIHGSEKIKDMLSIKDRETVIHVKNIKEAIGGSGINEAVYISGKITGDEDMAKKLFGIAENRLKSEGVRPINPMKLNHDHDKRWESYMRVCIKALCDCESIYMLSNWKESRGAVIEHDIAKDLGLNIIYED